MQRTNSSSPSERPSNDRPEVQPRRNSSQKKCIQRRLHHGQAQLTGTGVETTRVTKGSYGSTLKRRQSAHPAARLESKTGASPANPLTWLTINAVSMTACEWSQYRSMIEETKPHLREISHLPSAICRDDQQLLSRRKRVSV